MKVKSLLFYIITIIFFSCVNTDSFDDRPYVGIGIDIANLTSKEYDNLKLHIGGIENDTFISTDFFELPKIIVKPNVSFSQVITFEETRWQTDLEKIFEISNKAYFAVEFEDGQVVKVKESFENDSLLNFSVIQRGNEVKDKYGGRLRIFLNDNSIVTGLYFEDTTFR